MTNYRIPFWLRDALRRIENALVRKVLGQAAMPGGLDWFRRQFVDWKHGEIGDQEFVLAVEDYLHQLQQAGEALVCEDLLYKAVVEGKWLANGDLEWMAGYPMPTKRPLSDEEEAEEFTRHV